MMINENKSIKANLGTCKIRIDLDSSFVMEHDRPCEEGQLVAVGINVC